MPGVLRILNRTNIGGPVLNATLLTHFLAPEFETILVAGYPTPNEKSASDLLNKFGVKPLYMPEMGREMNPLGDLAAYRKIKKIIRDFKPVIVHTHAAKPGALGRMAAVAAGVPVVLHTFHGHVFHSYFSPAKTRFFIGVERFLAQRSSRIIAISPRQKIELAETFKITSSKKIEVVPLGLYLEPYQSGLDEKRERFRQEFGISEETVVISIIGRLAPVKNHSLFLKALDHIKKVSTQPFKAFIVGDGECRSEMIQLCQTLGLSYSLPEKPDFSAEAIFTSWRTDIDVINAGSDIIALSSLNEGTPVSLIEAQASGKPIVATNCGGMLDVVLPNETALIAEQGNEKPFFDHLASLVNDKYLRIKMGEKGPAWARERYGHQRLVGDIRTLYYKLLQEAGK